MTVAIRWYGDRSTRRGAATLLSTIADIGRGGVEVQQARVGGGRRSTVVAILFADICQSVTLYERQGDAEAQRLVAGSVRSMVEATDRHQGRLIGTRGDGVLSAFPTADCAFAAACDMQETHASGPLAIKVGLSLGPVIEEAGEIFGDVVNTASRVMGLARAGEILMTEEIVALLDAARLAATQPFDTVTVKGRAKPVRLFRVVADGGTQATQLFLSDHAPENGFACRSLLLSYGEAIRIRLDAPAQLVALGRDDGCDIVVRSRFASRRHAIIEAKRGAFVLTDTSTNGTFVLDQDNAVSFLRRDQFTLLGRGLIFLGEGPGGDTIDPVSYRCSTPGGSAGGEEAC